MNTNNKTARRKRCSRQSRLALALQWMSNFEGSNIIKGYSTYFGVDKLCAIKELKMLGVEISEERKKQITDAQKRMISLRKKKKDDKEKNDSNLCESNEHFSFIAGYTSDGVAYGIAWDEAEEFL